MWHAPENNFIASVKLLICIMCLKISPFCVVQFDNHAFKVISLTGANDLSSGRAACCSETVLLFAESFSVWASYQIRKIAGYACAGNAGKVFPRHRFQRKPLVSDPGMHHGTCVTHVPWCMSGSLTCGDGENVPGIPRACAPAILRIWQEAHCHNAILNNVI